MALPRDESDDGAWRNRHWENSGCRLSPQTKQRPRSGPKQEAQLLVGLAFVRISMPAALQEVMMMTQIRRRCLFRYVAHAN